MSQFFLSFLLDTQAISSYLTIQRLHHNQDTEQLPHPPELFCHIPIQSNSKIVFLLLVHSHWETLMFSQNSVCKCNHTLCSFLQLAFFFLLSVMALRSIQGVALFISFYYLVCGGTTLCIFSSVEGYLGYFQFYIIMNRAAIKYASTDFYVNISFLWG